MESSGYWSGLVSGLAFPEVPLASLDLCGRRVWIHSLSSPNFMRLSQYSVNSLHDFRPLYELDLINYEISLVQAKVPFECRLGNPGGQLQVGR